jgi:hypothetical protein
LNDIVPSLFEIGQVVLGKILKQLKNTPNFFYLNFMTSHIKKKKNKKIPLIQACFMGGSDEINRCSGAINLQTSRWTPSRM